MCAPRSGGTGFVPWPRQTNGTSCYRLGSGICGVGLGLLVQCQYWVTVVVSSKMAGTGYHSEVALLCQASFSSAAKK